MTPLVALLAQGMEQVFGYPQRLLDAIGHPVIWQGRLIGLLDRALNRDGAPDEQRRNNGIVALAILLGLTLLASLAVLTVTRSVPFGLGWIIEGAVASSLLAGRQLHDAVLAVAEALGHSLEEGREAVSQIVGRDPETLDEAGIARAAVESLAENASDGLIAPLFWLVLLGLPGIALYKAINTADSMIGHKSARHLKFGWASARLDDLVNWVPARLTALLLAGAAFFVRGASPATAWAAATRDAPFHDSPNAGWPEAAMAGALGLGLGGARDYGGETHYLPQMGDGRRTLEPADIRAALRLYQVMRILAFVLVFALFMVLPL